MIALMRKDVYVVGKQMGLMVVLALVFSFVPNFETFGSAYLMVMTITLPMSALAYDEQCHWDMYMAMTPCRLEKIVLSKYLFTFLVSTLALAMTTALGFVQVLLGSESFDLAERLVEKGATLVMALTVNAISTPSTYRFGAEKGRFVMMGLCFGGCGLFVLAAKTFGAENLFGWMERVSLPVLGAIAAVGTVVLNIASFFLSVRFYRNRRAGMYG